MNEYTRTSILPHFERLAGRDYSLEVISGPDKGKTFRTTARMIRIGQSPECDFELDDKTISRCHAKIELDTFGHRLIDDDSKNGTFLNDLRIRDTYLPASATFRIGGDTIRFQEGEEQVEITLSRESRLCNMIGQSKAMREIFAILERVSPSELTVLVEGETGTGKELIADAVHELSKRKGPLVVFDCSAVAPNLIESELFGHVKGAFTGAVQTRKGAFERAENGTLFLDEIGELPLDLQPKLLRALEQRAYRPVGSDTPKSTNARIIAATNRQLSREVDAGHFRQDLYYRLAVLRIVLPPLRRRIEDIPLLVNHFLERMGSQKVQISYETILKLQHHPWRGNVRELRNFVERAAALATDDRLETKFLAPPTFGDSTVRPAAVSEEPDDTNSTLETPSEIAEADTLQIDTTLPFKDAKARLIEGFERAYWTKLMKESQGNISAAARTAGIHRKSAEYLLKKLDLHI